MIYSIPKLISLDSLKKVAGANCNSGSSAATNCTAGASAGFSCIAGSGN